jgi:hypothetical protein
VYTFSRDTLYTFLHEEGRVVLSQTSVKKVSQRKCSQLVCTPCRQLSSEYASYQQLLTHTNCVTWSPAFSVHTLSEAAVNCPALATGEDWLDDSARTVKTLCARCWATLGQLFFMLARFQTLESARLSPWNKSAVEGFWRNWRQELKLAQKILIVANGQKWNPSIASLSS